MKHLPTTIYRKSCKGCSDRALCGMNTEVQSEINFIIGMLSKNSYRRLFELPVNLKGLGTYLLEIESRLKRLVD